MDALNGNRLKRNTTSIDTKLVLVYKAGMELLLIDASQLDSSNLVRGDSDSSYQ